MQASSFEGAKNSFDSLGNSEGFTNEKIMVYTYCIQELLVDLIFPGIQHVITASNEHKLVITS